MASAPLPDGTTDTILKIAVLDDYVGRALDLADWASLGPGCRITVFDKPLSAEVAKARLSDFDVLCLMRERMTLTRELLEALPGLKLITVTGTRFTCVDLDATARLGISVVATGGQPTTAPAEHALALLLAAFRNIPSQHTLVRAGGWQTELGRSVQGSTIGVLGLGRFGRIFADFVRPLGAKLIAWSPNLTPGRAAEAGVAYVQKEEFFRTADAISIHMVLGETTRHLVGAAELALMKPDAVLVNTSRGPIVDEAAMIVALVADRLGCAALDVFDVEPLPAGHPLRSLPNALATPHLGYCTEVIMRNYHERTVREIRAWAAQRHG